MIRIVVLTVYWLLSTSIGLAAAAHFGRLVMSWDGRSLVSSEFESCARGKKTHHLLDQIKPRITITSVGV